MSRSTHVTKCHPTSSFANGILVPSGLIFAPWSLYSTWLIQEEIKSRLKSGAACCLSVQNLLPSSLLSKNLKIKKYRTVILPVVLYGCETWSLALREEPRLRVFENCVLRRMSGPKRDEVKRAWGNCSRSLMICTTQPILFGCYHREDGDGRACSTYGGD